MNIKHAIIKFLQLGLDLLKADPADKEAIKALQQENADLVARLNAAEETAFTGAELDEVNGLLSQFEAATVAPTPPPADTPPADA